MNKDSTPHPEAHIITPDGEFADDILMPRIAYGMHALGMVLPITHLVAAIIAYVNRGDAPEWMRSHFTFQIRTFWIGLLYTVIAGSTWWIFGIGWLIGIFTAIWLIARIAIGWSALENRRAVRDPESWMFGN